ncbi:M48 family metallopeptidase [Anatilimnocola floriformis]|uniref:M48 family metallopeptidase n=1 Tax=Anatilimnocola floriformis TaxID=2948575 RepID=UPI0020C1BA8E|nr:M48 family metallopeptidase [Anatilimnocola floriformis]
MPAANQNATVFPFFKTFVLPALLIFLVPLIGYFFFRHAQSRYDGMMRETILSQVQADQRLDAEGRANAVEFFSKVPFSRLVQNEEFARDVPSNLKIYFATFRWMILIAGASIVLGIGVFVVAGICVVCSLRSHYAQYLSLLVGWHVLRIFGALQAVAQGTLLVALSYWMTALWTNSFYPQLIVVVGILAVVAVCLVIAAIFRRVKNDFVVPGQMLEKDAAGPIWDEMKRICARVGTEPPDQIIAGIDDNFYVTERPVTVGGKEYHGRTLFVSLSLLKQLQGGEADAVLAHEMAHFSGQDTLYSRKIGPLLVRYDTYLKALHDGFVTWPIYSFMLCFRALFQLSLGKLSRQREFRADRVAMEATSPRDAAGALLRTVAYSKYWSGIEAELFEQERALENINVCERIERGFHEYASKFASSTDIGELAPAHPFDSHPPLEQRLAALGMQLDSADTQALLTTPGDGQWYRTIPAAEPLEAEQWKAYEDRFCAIHEQSLPYRFLPETDEERAIVEQTFPPETFTSRKGDLSLDHEKFKRANWPAPIRFAEITGLLLENNVLKIDYNDGRKQSLTLPISEFARQTSLISAIQNYYGRYLAAAEYQKQKKAKGAAK